MFRSEIGSGFEDRAAHPTKNSEEYPPGKKYSHCTWMYNVSDALPHSLLASHLYSPVLFLWMLLSTNSLPWTCWPSAVIQYTIGVGLPDAWHDRVTLLPSVTVIFCIAAMDEGTVKKMYQNNLWLKHRKQHKSHYIYFSYKLCKLWYQALKVY